MLTLLSATFLYTVGYLNKDVGVILRIRVAVVRNSHCNCKGWSGVYRHHMMHSVWRLVHVCLSLALALEVPCRRSKRY